MTTPTQPIAPHLTPEQQKAVENLQRHIATLETQVRDINRALSQTQSALESKQLECDNLHVQVDRTNQQYCDTVKALEQAQAYADMLRRELVSHREKAQGNYWAWQGDGEDHLESLVYNCQVVIHAHELLAIVKSRDQAQQERDEAQQQLNQSFRGILYLRCKSHLTVPQQNKNEFDGGECGACIAQQRDELQAKFDALQKLYNEGESDLEREVKYVSNTLMIKGEHSLPESVDNWLAKYKELQARCAKLEAACCERGALLKKFFDGVNDATDGRWNGPFPISDCIETMAKTHKALSTACGQPLLDRMERMRKALESAEQRLTELLQVHEFIDNSYHHQSKATVPVLLQVREALKETK